MNLSELSPQFPLRNHPGPSGPRIDQTIQKSQKTSENFRKTWKTTENHTGTSENLLTKTSWENSKRLFPSSGMGRQSSNLLFQSSSMGWASPNLLFQSSNMGRKRSDLLLQSRPSAKKWDAAPCRVVSNSSLQAAAPDSQALTGPQTSSIPLNFPVSRTIY